MFDAENSAYCPDFARFENDAGSNRRYPMARQAATVTY